MAKGIFYVESRPSAPERVAEFNDWYDNVHLPEIVACEGFTAARRLAPVEDDGPHVSLYEIEGEDLVAIIDGMKEKARTGRLQMSDAIQMDPPPNVRLLEVTLELDKSS